MAANPETLINKQSLGEEKQLPLYLVRDPKEVQSRYEQLRSGKDETELRALAIDLGLMAAIHTVVTRHCAIPLALSEGVGNYPEFSHLRDSFDRTKSQITI